jgi:hypothetical protein
MSITHEQAHRLIQLNMEHMLDSRESARLSAHLRECRECDTYARQIKEVTNLLPTMMKRQWSAQPVPLSLAVLMRRRQSNRASTLLTMRTAALGLVFMALFFSTWQSVLPGPPSSSHPPLQAPPPVPTPSTQHAQSTSTNITLQDCEMILYPVGELDSLASIAAQFSVSKDTIMGLNHLQSEVIHSSMELLIPICNFTPTGTLHASTFTTTYTPLIIATTFTPVDRH